MNHRSLAALGLTITLLSARAHAQQTQDDDDDDAKKVSDKASSKATNKAPAKASQAAPAADETADETEDGADAKASKATSDVAREDAAAMMAARITPAQDADLRAPVFGKRSDWLIQPYGYARLDAIEDSTQSFEDGIQPNLIQRAGTYRGDHPRTIFTARDSRLGFFVAAPKYQSIRSFSQIEFDFYGLVPTDARRHDSVVFGPLRIRLAYLKMETPIVDIVAGQYYDLFGWNGSFYPATVAYLGVPAEIYHRNPQLRIEKKLELGPIELLLAGAAVRPGQRDSGLPEGQLGVKISIPRWHGAAMPGFGRPALAPFALGLSALYRAFEVPLFRAEPGSASEKTYGYGFAANLLVPIIPVRTIQDRGNALTLTGEFTIGTGIADMYTFMDGGSRFPILPNPNLSQPAIQYQANVDPGLVTFDRNLEVKTINWEAFVGGLQYYLPIDHGRVWVSGLYSRIWSNNIKELTPFPSWGGVFTKMEYLDGNIGIDLTPGIVLGLSFQTVSQTFADESADTPIYGAIPGNMLGGLSMPGTGGVAAHARNNRGQLSMSFFF